MITKAETVYNLRDGFKEIYVIDEKKYGELGVYRKYQGKKVALMKHGNGKVELFVVNELKTNEKGSLKGRDLNDSVSVSANMQTGLSLNVDCKSLADFEAFDLTYGSGNRAYASSTASAIGSGTIEVGYSPLQKEDEKNKPTVKESAIGNIIAPLIFAPIDLIFSTLGFIAGNILKTSIKILNSRNKSKKDGEHSIKPFFKEHVTTINEKASVERTA